MLPLGRLKLIKHTYHHLPIPNQVLIDVFARLPVESVLKCKLVCRAWRTLIEDDPAAFCHAYTHVFHSNYICNGNSLSLSFTVDFLLHNHGDAEDEGEYEGEGEGDRIIYWGRYNANVNGFQVCEESITRSQWNFINGYIIGSCNGLISFDSGEHSEEIDSWICNPLTREYVTLPRSKHPCRRLVAMGFGYHPSTNEYKVVRVHSRRARGQVEVYTLGSQQWRIKQHSVALPKLTTGSLSGTYYNGALYWLVNREVIRFDLGAEKLTVPSLSLSLLESCEVATCSSLRVMRGRLCLTVHNNGSPVKLGIWELDKQQTSWKNFITYQDRLLPRAPRHIQIGWDDTRHIQIGWLEPLANSESGQLLMKYAGSKDYSLLLYDPETDSYSFVGKACQPGDADMIPYMKSYVSLKVLGEENAVQVARFPEKPSTRFKILNQNPAV